MEFVITVPMRRAEVAGAVAVAGGGGRFGSVAANVTVMEDATRPGTHELVYEPVPSPDRASGGSPLSKLVTTDASVTGVPQSSFTSRLSKAGYPAGTREPSAKALSVSTICVGVQPVAARETDLGAAGCTTSVTRTTRVAAAIAMVTSP